MEPNQTHIHKFTSIVIPANCKEKGYTIHKCECGYEHKDNFTPIGTHSYKITNEKRPNCTESGEQTFCCEFCGDTKTQITKALGHAWNESEITKHPTCTEEGVRTYRCDFCQETKTEPLYPIGHVWSEWAIKEFATCTKEGKKSRFCTRCNCEEEDVIPAKGHDFSSRKKSETEKGVTECFCKNCGETIKVPTKSAKAVAFFKAHKKVIASITAILLIISIMIPITKYLILPSPCYNKAQECIKAGDYEKAYDYLLLCGDYKDSKELLNDFRVGYKKEEALMYCWYVIPDGKYVYENDENGNVVRKTYYNENSEIYSETTYINEYDNANRLIRITECTDDGKKVLDYTAEYDKNGKITSQIYYNSDGEISTEYTYEYDENGNQTRYSWESDYSSYEIIYKYDDENKLISSTSYDRDDYDGEFTSEYTETVKHTEYHYDADGELTKTITRDEDDNITYEAIYRNGIVKKATGYTSEGKKSYVDKYDKNGRLNSYVRYNDTGAIGTKTKREYNKEGFHKSEKQYNSFGIQEYKIKYKYYDRFIIYNPAN